MKKRLKTITQTLIYFFTPEDSSALAGQGSLSFDLSLSEFGIGSVKTMFWILGGVGIMSLICLM